MCSLQTRSILVAVCIAAALPATGQTLPQGFTDSLVAQVAFPTALAFLPDGRILAASQTGSLRVIQEGRLLPEPVNTIPAALICSNSERGLLGVAVDPQFSLNGFVYLFYTYRALGRDCGNGSVTNPTNRVSRFVMTSAGKLDLATETVLIENIPSFNGNHNAGDLKFDKTGNLLVSTGDGGCHYAKGPAACAPANDAAREKHTLLGKILRIDRDGNIPAGGNPWTGLPGAVRCNKGSGQPGQLCEETYLWGLRNPFRIAVRPETNSVFINDVGQDTWEEIDEGVPGADYGWNVREGFCATGSVTDCDTAAMTGSFRNPIYAYRHDVLVPDTQSSGCNSLAGGTFVPETIWNAWPVSMGGYYFVDFVCGSMFRLSWPLGLRLHLPPSLNEFGRGFGNNSLVALELGPYRNTKALYYTTYARNGEVHRIVGFTAASAASYVRSFLTPDSLASLFGTGLAGATLIVRDSAGVPRNAEVLFTSETQMNFVVPPATALGGASLVASKGSVVLASTVAEIRSYWPGVFTANGDGSGVPLASAVRVNGNVQQPLPVYDCPQGPGSCVPVPIDVTKGDIYLSLYGTGIRGGNSATVTAGGTPLEVQYAGPQSQYPGLDQINVRLPASLAGSGEVRLIVGRGDADVGQFVTIVIL